MYYSEHLGDFCNSDWICESAMDILLILYNCVFVIDLCITVIVISQHFGTDVLELFRGHGQTLVVLL